LKERFSNNVTESVEGIYSRKPELRHCGDAAVLDSSYSHALDGMLKLFQFGRHGCVLQPVPGKMRL
jgi:hypothetical protein